VSPGDGFLVLASSLTAIGSVPVAALALIVGVDRPDPRRGRVFTNVLENTIATIVVATWEGNFDQHRAKQVLYDTKHNPHPLTSEAELKIEDIDMHHDPADAADCHAAGKATSHAH
jgi:aerobic C4-dicarboxylate transport protein